MSEFEKRFGKKPPKVEYDKDNPVDKLQEMIKRAQWLFRQDGALWMGKWVLEHCIMIREHKQVLEIEIAELEKEK